MAGVTKEKQLTRNYLRDPEFVWTVVKTGVLELKYRNEKVWGTTKKDCVSQLKGYKPHKDQLQ